MANYTYQEAIHNSFIRHIKPEFNLNSNPSNEALLIRLLLGTVGVTNILSTERFDQFANYSVLGHPLNAVISTRLIKECLEPEAELTDLCEHIMDTRTINDDFFLNLLEELTSYFYKTSKSSHTTGFLHLYRSLEYMSYSFPLIYASISRDYYGSFGKLRSYFHDPKTSELNFFNEFTRQLLDTALLDTPLNFNFVTLNNQVNKNHFDIIKRILGNSGIDNSVPNVSITTSYRHLLGLAVDLRNRYFHFAIGSGQRNIRATEIIESDTFFKLINEELLNWLSIIYFEVLKASVLQ